MPAENKFELVVEVDANKANASIKSINTGLPGMEQAAGKAARGALRNAPGARTCSRDPFPLRLGSPFTQAAVVVTARDGRLYRN